VNISFRIRRKRMVAVGVLALALGGLAAVFPVRAALAAVGTGVITDAVTTGDVTAKDTIVTCNTFSQIAIGGTQAVALPVGCLTEYNTEWIKVTWSGTGVSTELTQQSDGNFVLYAGNGKKWGAATRFADNANGPGCLAGFQGDANLVVRNCDNGAAIWASGTHTYPNAVLAFQADGNLVIYSSTSGTALWSTKTS
jgi:hypothetical protein